MFAPATALALSDTQCSQIDALLRNGNIPQKLASRCRIVLLAHQCLSNRSIAHQLGLSRSTVIALRAEFA